MRIICDFMLSWSKSITPMVHPKKSKSKRCPRSRDRKSTSCDDQTVRPPPGLPLPCLPTGPPPGFEHVVVDDAGTDLQWALQSPAYSWRWSPYDLHHFMMLGCAGEACENGFAFVDECGSWDRERNLICAASCDGRLVGDDWGPATGDAGGCAAGEEEAGGRRALRAARRPAMTRDVFGREIGRY